MPRKRRRGNPEQRRLVPESEKTFDRIEGLQETGFDDIEIRHVKSGRMVCATEAGGRSKNEDAVFFDFETDTFVVADGMGGYERGKDAADITCTEIAQGLSGDEDPFATHRHVRARLREAGIAQGGAAYISGRIQKKKFRVMWGGDCRGFIIGVDGTIRERFGGSPLRDGIRGISHGYPHTDIFDVMNFDRIVFVGDGVTDNVGDDELLEDVAQVPIDSAAQNLRNRARRVMDGERRRDGAHGNKDNITVLIYEILPVPSRGKKINPSSVNS